ncbi:MAG: hypothetical protein KatS3mg034_1846 [Vicingaceae bacterium]|nr:MAG: hypothetical protein KatS3mg034_1846 [Vicingaceae bacterium]
MKNKAHTVEDYINNLPEERKSIIKKLRKVILDNLPEGFEETIQYNMIGYVVPHTIYPSGYHCNPDEPLPFIHLASQKNHMALYHMGLYADKNLIDWFLNEYAKQISGKPNMGKSCIRFKKESDIPYELIGELCRQITPQQWITMYETIIIRKK